MSRLTLSLAACGYALVLILLPVLRIPGISLSAEFQKGILAALGLGLFCVIAGGITLLSRRALAVPLQPLSFAGGLLVVASLLSWAFTGFTSMSFWGLGFDMGTVSSCILFALAIVAGSTVPIFQVRFLLHLFIGVMVSAGSVAAGLFLLTGSSSVFSSWPQLSFMVGAALVCAAALYEWGTRSTSVRVLLLCEGAILAAIFLLFFNVSAVFVLLLLFSILCAIHIALSEHAYIHKRFPIYSATLLVVFLLAFLLGLRAPLLSLPPEIRLTLTATELVGGPVYFSGVQNALFGSGPNSFSDVWDTYQPVEINTTPLWNTSFTAGYSTASTWAVTLGLFGVLILFFYPLLFLFWWYVKSRGTIQNLLMEQGDVCAAATLIALYAFCAGVIYTITLPLFLVGALAAGFLLRSLHSEKKEVAPLFISGLFIRVPVALLFFVFGVSMVWISSRQLFGAYHHAHGVAAFEKKDNTEAAASLYKAVTLWPSPQYASDASRLSFELANVVAASPESNKETIQSHISDAVSYSNMAIQWAPKSYSTQLSSASLYVGLTALNVSGADAQASTSLNRARILGPTHPEVPYLQAVLATGLGKIEESRDYLKKTLIVKPDYEPALELLKRIGE